MSFRDRFVYSKFCCCFYRCSDAYHLCASGFLDQKAAYYICNIMVWTRKVNSWQYTYSNSLKKCKQVMPQYCFSPNPSPNLTLAEAQNIWQEETLKIIHSWVAVWSKSIKQTKAKYPLCRSISEERNRSWGATPISGVKEFRVIFRACAAVLRRCQL